MKPAPKIAVFSARWTDSFWDVPLLLLVLQFPAYAILLTVAGLRGRLRLAAGTIFVAHVLGVLPVPRLMRNAGSIDQARFDAFESRPV